MATYISGPGGELYHFKYVKREKVGDRWRYWYPEDLKRAAANAASSVATAAGNAINNGINKVKSITPEDVQRKRAEIETAAKKAWGVDAKKALDSAEYGVKNTARREQEARNDWAAARSEHRKALQDVEKSRAERKKMLETEYDPVSRWQKPEYVKTRTTKLKDGSFHIERDKAKRMKTDREYMEEDAAKLRPSREAEAKAKTQLDKRTAQTNTAKDEYNKALKAYNRTPMAIVAKSKDALKAGAAAVSKYGSKKLSDIKRGATSIRDDRALKKAVHRITEQDEARLRIKRNKADKAFEDWKKNWKERSARNKNQSPKHYMSETEKAREAWKEQQKKNKKWFL